MQIVQNDLNLVKLLLEGNSKATNHSRDLLETFKNGEVPSRWKSFATTTTSTQQFVSELSIRLKQISDLIDWDDFKTFKICLGKCFDPTAYITASRQMAAKDLNRSLESIFMSFSLTKPVSVPCFTVTGMKMIGADWKNSKLELKDEITAFELPVGYIAWNLDYKESNVSIPVYINPDRKQVLLFFGIDDTRVYEIVKRAVAIIA